MDWDKDYTRLREQMGWPQVRTTGLSADLNSLHRRTMAALAGTEPKPTAGERVRAAIRRAKKTTRDLSQRAERHHPK